MTRNCSFCGIPLQGRQTRLCRFCRMEERLARERSHGWHGADPLVVARKRAQQVQSYLQQPEGDRPFWWTSDPQEAQWLAQKSNL